MNVSLTNPNTGITVLRILNVEWVRTTPVPDRNYDWLKLGNPIYKGPETVMIKLGQPLTEAQRTVLGSTILEYNETMNGLEVIANAFTVQVEA